MIKSYLSLAPIYWYVAVNAWLVSNSKWAICQLYNEEDKLHFDEMTPTLY